MLTVRVCSSWESVVFTNKVEKNSRYFVGVFNKTIIPLALVGYEMILAIPDLRSLPADVLWGSFVTSAGRLGPTRLVGYLPSHIQRALVERLLNI